MKQLFWGAWAMASLLAGQSLQDLAEEHYRKGMRLSAAGQWAEARQEFLLGKVSAPADIRFPIELAGVAYKAGDREAAKDELHRALRLDPTDPYANEVLGSLYVLDGNLAAALPYWNRIGDPVIRSVVLPDPRPRLFDRAIEVNPGDPLLRSDYERTAANLERLGISYRMLLAPVGNGQHDLLVEAGSGGGWPGWRTVALSAASTLPYEAVWLTFQPQKGWARRIDSMVRWDANKRRAFAYFTGAVANNPRLLLTFGGQAYDEIWDLRPGRESGFEMRPFRMRRWNGLLQLEQGLTGRLTWTNSFSFGMLDFTDAPSPAAPFTNGTQLVAGSNLGWRAMSLPEKQASIDVSFDAELGRIFSQSDVPQSEPFTRLQAGAALNWMLGPSASTGEVSAAVRGGWSQGPVSFDRLYMLGMERDNDLWLRGYLGAHEGRKGSSPLGGRYLLSQFDFQKTLYRRPFLAWSAGPFLDIGSAGGPWGTASFGPYSWAWDAGVETRLRIMDSLIFVAAAGHDMRNGGTVFYTAVRKK